MKLIIDIADNDYELLNKAVITPDLHTTFHGNEKDRKMTFALFNLVKAMECGTIYDTQGDLISRETLKQAIENYLAKRQDVLIWETDMFDMLDNAPTVEAIPLEVHEKAMDVAVTDLFKVQEELNRIRNEKRKGEWYYSCQNGWHCSICHESVKDMPTVMRKAIFNFCPNCGADMRGDKNET